MPIRQWLCPFVVCFGFSWTRSRAVRTEVRMNDSYGHSRPWALLVLHQPLTDYKVGAALRGFLGENAEVFLGLAASFL